MSNIKYIVFIIIVFLSLFGGIGDILDLRSGASHHGNGYTLNTIFPYIGGSFTENPANVAYEGNATFSYSQFFPAGGTLFNIAGRHAIGTLSAEFPMFNYFACGISYGYSSYVDDNLNIYGAPFAGGVEGGSLKNVEMVVNTTVLFTTYPKRPKGLKLKKYNKALAENSLLNRYKRNSAIKRRVFKIPFSLGVGINYLYYNFQKSISGLKSGSSYHGLLLNIGSSVFLVDHLKFSLYINDLHLNNKKNYNLFLPVLDFHLGGGLGYEARGQKLNLYMGVGYRIPGNLTEKRIDSSKSVFTLAQNFIIPFYRLTRDEVKGGGKFVLSKAGMRINFNTDFSRGHGFGTSFFVDIGTPLRYLRFEYGFSYRSISPLSHTISINYSFYERP